jgi:tetratricopeptide (TPR) repeat protein
MRSDHERAPVRNNDGRIPRRLMAMVRRWLATMLNPAMVISSPVIHLVARQRKRAVRRLPAGSQPEQAQDSLGSLDPLHRAHRASDGGRPRLSAGTRRAPHSAAAPPDEASPAYRAGDSRAVGADREARGEALFSVVAVEPDFGPHVYAIAFGALQRPLQSKLFDLTRAKDLDADVFERLATAWAAPPGSVPRLGIVLPFARWVMVRDRALLALQPLAAAGTKIELFYGQQVDGPRMAAWFGHGQFVHNVRGAIEALAHPWQPSPISPIWPMVIDTLAQLVRAHTCTQELPALLTKVAGLALSYGGAEQATTLAREALNSLPETPSATRGKALRALGTGMIAQGQATYGLALLDEAIAVAAAIQDPSLGASALCQSGMYALNHGDFAGAARRFRDAIALLARARRPNLLASAHHLLATALMQLGGAEAEEHAATALALRPDPDSHLAEEDRILLTQLRERRMTTLN